MLLSSRAENLSALTRSGRTVPGWLVVSATSRAQAKGAACTAGDEDAQTAGDGASNTPDADTAGDDTPIAHAIAGGDAHAPAGTDRSINVPE